MKFFWKIFFSSMFVSIICFSLGGYIMIDHNFNSLLQKEVKKAFDLNDVVYYSLESEVNNITNSLQSLKPETELIKEIAESIKINSINDLVSFEVIEKSSTRPIFSSLKYEFDKQLINHLSDTKRGYMIQKTEDSSVIQTLRPATFFSNKYYIETIHDISYIFENQKEQYQTLFRIMLMMLIIAGLMTTFIAKLLIRHVLTLTKITKEISDGNLDKRVMVKGNDEFSNLSRSFNKMADDLEEKIQQLQNEAEKQERFVAAFSHELKTPLTSIIGYSDMLCRKKIDNQRIHLCANYILTEGKRLETLSMRLLDLIVLKTQKIECKTLNSNNFFKEIIAVIEPQFLQSNIKLTSEIESCKISFDPELIKTVFINILDNARKAVECDGRITLAGKIEKDDYIVTITDNGKGMPKHELAKIKDAFYMVDKSRSRKLGGVGLGLSICDEIIKLHGFEIIFESILDKGTTVIVKMKGAKVE